MARTWFGIQASELPAGMRRARPSSPAPPKSVRVGIPRVLVALYDIRNNRGVGHVGGDVDANHINATFVLHSAQWVMAELMRVFHQTDVITATEFVSTLVDRVNPLVWRVGDRRRVLDRQMSLADQTLILLYSSSGGFLDKELARDLKQPRLSNYKRVLKRLDDDLKVEYNEFTGYVAMPLRLFLPSVPEVAQAATAPCRHRGGGGWRRGACPGSASPQRFTEFWWEI